MERSTASRSSTTSTTHFHTSSTEIAPARDGSCVCAVGRQIAPRHKLDLDVHFAEVNGISYEEQKQRTARAMRQIQGLPEIKDPKEDPKPMN